MERPIDDSEEAEEARKKKRLEAAGNGMGVDDRSWLITSCELQNMCIQYQSRVCEFILEDTDV